MQNDESGDIQVLQDAFDEAGIQVQVREEIDALVASGAAVPILYAVVAVGGASFLKSFAEELGASCRHRESIEGCRIFDRD